MHNELIEEEKIGIECEAPYYTYAGVPFVPCVWEGKQECAPLEFNALTIRLDGGIHSDLTWSHAREEAKKAVSQGFCLMWDLNLGLFQGLPHPLSNQTQYLSLALSLQHFKESLWADFKHVTLGISLYRGDADFSHQFAWDEEHLENFRKWLEQVFGNEEIFEKETSILCSSLAQIHVEDLRQSKEGEQLLRLFCRDVAMEYVGLLGLQVPESLPVFLFLDAASLAYKPIHQIQLLHPEKMEAFNLAVHGITYPLQGWGWQNLPSSFGYSGTESFSSTPALKDIKIGVCLPSSSFCRPSHWQGLESALTLLKKCDIPFKLIAEGHLITNWDGLDYLIYAPAGLSKQGKRKLQGFCAAGGTVVSTAQTQGFPYEMDFAQFFKTLS